MEDLNTETISAPQPGSIDIAGGGEDRIKRQTSERTQCSSVETNRNHLGSQPEKAWSPAASVPICQAQGPSIEPPGTLTVKMPSAVLPLCLGESTVLLPVHLQMPAGPPPQQAGHMGATPLLLSSHSPGSLPVVLEQQVFQCFNSQLLPQGTLCSAPPPLQNNILCQNSSVTFCQPAPLKQKVAEPGAVEQAGLAFVPSPGFADISQDQFATHNSFMQFSSQRAGASPTGAVPSSALPIPPLTLPYPYSSSLAPLVPPPTLLVPFPVVIPLPVPVPIPIPIPIPFSAKAEFPKPTRSADLGTQTCNGCPSPVYHPADSEEGALDLSMVAGPSRLKQEFVMPEESPLDLSLENHDHKPLVQVEHPDVKQPVKDLQKQALSLDTGSVLQPWEFSQNLDSKPLNGLTSLEFSRHHKWLVDRPHSHESQFSTGNYDIVSPSQTAKVIVAVKDSVPAIFQGKLRELAGIPPSAVSSKQDVHQAALVQQHCSPVLKAQRQTGPHDNPRRGRTVKLKKLNVQEIHILPIKKQRFAPFFHGE
ncbi:hypothetical protein ACEWY4_016594 [Coilia grayii]|uniref:Retinoic acid induced 2 n=1 Tax=Coilia grayii TaxID=363190 RepID=A0ABD1JM09_9TELE